jgi:hypothetical protein
MTRSPRRAAQTAIERGGGETGSGKKEAGANSGATVNRWVGVGVATTGRYGNIKDTAKWQSTQWVQVVALGSAAALESWHGMAALTVTVVSMLTVRAMTMGIAAASAPESGSHTSINATINLRNNFIPIRLA